MVTHKDLFLGGACHAGLTHVRLMNNKNGVLPQTNAEAFVFVRAGPLVDTHAGLDAAAS